MKYLKQLILGIFLMPTILSFAQQSEINDSISIEDLAIPNSPALMLLDKAPSSIDNPINAKALIVSIANSIDDDAKIPLNYGVEFSPLWYLRNTNMNVYKFAGINETNDKVNIFSELRNASVSVGFSSNQDTLTNMNINNVSYGARANLITIRQKNYSKRVKKHIESIQNELINFSEKKDRPIFDIENETWEEYRKKDEKWFSKNVKTLKSNKDSLQNIITEKPLFLLSIAYGKNTVFDNNDFTTNRFGRSAIWSTASSSLKLTKSNNKYLNIYVMARNIMDPGEIVNEEITKTSKFDIGSKIELELNDLILSYEYVHRSREDNSNTVRSSGLVKYKVNDDLAITGSFGRNFGDENNLISFLGLNWGFQNSVQKQTEIKQTK